MLLWSRGSRGPRTPSTHRILTASLTRDTPPFSSSAHYTDCILEHTEDSREVMQLGSDGLVTPTQRPQLLRPPLKSSSLSISQYPPRASLSR